MVRGLCSPMVYTRVIVFVINENAVVFYGWVEIRMIYRKG